MTTDAPIDRATPHLPSGSPSLHVASARRARGGVASTSRLLAAALPVALLAAALAPAAARLDDADTAAKIANAMGAAPSAVSANATILDWETDKAGAFAVLREGENGWFCLPDTTGTPGDDPMCLDQTWLDWFAALTAGEEPEVGVPGLAYMLQGGSDASNTDPFATEPAPDEGWVTSPPHVMLLLPEDLDPAAFSTDHHAGGPYVMWAGTPYEHIMMPVADATTGG